MLVISTPERERQKDLKVKVLSRCLWSSRLICTAWNLASKAEVAPGKSIPAIFMQQKAKERKTMSVSIRQFYKLVIKKVAETCQLSSKLVQYEGGKVKCYRVQNTR